MRLGFDVVGLGVDNVLAMEVVLPNGTKTTVTSCSFPDLWFALRGGGGGTYGVVVAATHRLHHNPGFVGLAAGYPIGVYFLLFLGAKASLHIWNTLCDLILQTLPPAGTQLLGYHK